MSKIYFTSECFSPKPGGLVDVTTTVALVDPILPADDEGRVQALAALD